MSLQTRIHDGVIALLILASVGLAWAGQTTLGLGLGALVGLIMASSVFTGFCPVHYTVNKLFPPDR